MNRILAVATNTFRETIREKVLYNLVFFAIIMILSGLLLKDLSIRQDVKIVKDIGLAAMEIFGTMIALFMGVGLVRKEIERRSLYPLLAKPLTRGEFLVGKFAGLSFTLLINMSVMTAGLYATLYVTRRSIDVTLLKAIYPIFIGLMLVVAVALLLSTITSSALAAVGTVGLVIAGRFADVLLNMREVAPGVPAWLTQVLYWAVPNLRNFDLKDRVVHGEVVEASQLVWITLYGLTYIVFLLTATLVVFRSKDLE